MKKIKYFYKLLNKNINFVGTSASKKKMTCLKR